MTKTLQLPKTLQQAVAFFSDPQKTFDYAVRLRWPSGTIACPRCGDTAHSFISTRRIWFCKGCKKQFTVKVGTIFEDSALGMDKWMIAVWMLVNCKNGISSYEVGRALGVTQKTAWFMMHRIRAAMQGNSLVKIGGQGKDVEWMKPSSAARPALCTKSGESVRLPTGELKGKPLLLESWSAAVRFVPLLFPRAGNM